MNLLHRISYGVIVVTVLGLVAMPIFAATVYFGNIGDQPANFKESGYPTGSFKNEGPCAQIPNDATKGYIRDYIVQAATFFKLPPAFIAAVMKQESAFNPNAGSSAGARGLMQLMPGTYSGLNTATIKSISKDLAAARGYGKADASLRQIYIKQIESQGSPPVPKPLGAPTNEDIVNMKYNVFLGTAYYRGHYDAFKKTFTSNIFEIILAAYNAGPGAVQQYHGIPPYRETVTYVKNIMQYYTEYQGCSLTGTETSAHGQAIADKARAAIGTGSVCYLSSDPRNACAAFASAMINPVAGTRLDNSAPSNWANGGGQTVNITDVQPGDEIFWTRGTKYIPGTDPAYFGTTSNQVVPTHVGIYIGHYEGPNGRGQTINIDNAVVNNSSTLEKIVVDPLTNHPSFGSSGIYGIKRY